MEKAKLKNLLNRWRYQLKEIKNNRTYIMPTKLGWYYATLCFLLLIVAFIYNNNVVYYSCFALVSLGLTSLLQTNYNMHRIKIKPLSLKESHAEHPTTLRFLIENISNQPSYELKFHFDSIFLMKQKMNKEINFINRYFTVPILNAKETVEIEFNVIFTKRGEQSLPHLIGETTFPFSLFKSWKIKIFDEKVILFPAKKGNLPMPNSTSFRIGELLMTPKNVQSGYDFYGHREYRTNDSFRHIDWKAFARNNKLNIKLFENEDQGSQLISWEHTKSISDFELQISQITLWISECERKRKDFVLEMPYWIIDSRQEHFKVTDCYLYLSKLKPNDFSDKKNSNPIYESRTFFEIRHQT